MLYKLLQRMEKWCLLGVQFVSSERIVFSDVSPTSFEEQVIIPANMAVYSTLLSLLEDKLLNML